MKAMKPKARTKILLPVFTSIILAAGVSSCAVPGNQGKDIQDISLQWMAIERNLAAEICAIGKRDVIEKLAAFQASVRSFLDSGLYKAFRLLPPPSGELPAVYDLDALIVSLRQALLDNDRENALRACADISSIIIGMMTQDRAANRFLADAYSRLLLISAVFIVLAGISVYFLVNVLSRSLKHGEESSAFSRAVLLAQEDERKRISRELHDTVVQDLRRLSLEMGKIARAEDGDEREKLCAESSTLQSALASRLRDICNSIIPPDFALQGLPDALRQLCHDFGKRTRIDCRIDIAKNTDLGFLDREKLLQIYRIVQEALTNVEKHARAKEAVVVLRSEADGSLSVIVSDDGGELKAKAENSARLGLRGMNERALLLGGTLTINNPQKEGTLVHLRIPPYSAPVSHGTNAKEVLIIDDHLLANTALASLLEGAAGGLSVAGQATTLEEAMRFIKEAENLPSLIILDIQLGKENGLDILPLLEKFCKARGIPKPPVLVCSAFDDSFHMQIALKQGASGYVPKTASGETLLAAITSVLRGEIYAPEGYHAEPASGVYDKFTRQELKILELVRQEKTNRQIADALFLSIRTVETHIGNMLLKTGAADRKELREL